ncbi:MAG: hypothetical protein JWN61_3193 [Pseudonocardiales bacterium]|nr:hypothetical protein [Pseudonocardiales bacterium]
MTSANSASIIPITLTVNDRTGLTLWAPPWTDADGEDWQGFLGDGSKILLFPGTRDLAQYIASGVDNDLSDHPAWGRVLQAPPDALRPSREDAYDLDAVYEWAAEDPTPVNISSLANVIDMTLQIADCCDDGALRRLVGSTPEYAEILQEDVSYQGKEGRKAWSALGDVIADTWERALGRVEQWLEWVGDFDAEDASDLDEEALWSEVGAAPIEIIVPDGTFYTVRADWDDQVLFLGHDMTVSVFTSIDDLATFCRRAEDHDLIRLELWDRIRIEEDDDAFAPDAPSQYDLTLPSGAGATLIRELVTYCQLDVDLDVLDQDSVDEDDWAALVAEIVSCFATED